jgi:glutamyl-tRNA synthetase
VSSSARVRFAPSPTGYLHLGSARAALFNWLAARHMGGTFLLRIEDTDKDRSRPELIDVIYEGLEWLGLDWDEEPLHQSSRDEAHQEAIEALLRDDLAYDDEGAVRFRVPTDGAATSWDDLIRGEISVEHANIEDFVIRRSDGSPTFFLANASDDAHMGITHVIRGEDLINVTPKYLLLRRAMGIEGPDPEFAHMPLIVNEQRKKLSKRRDDVSLMDYRDRGFLARAMVNYLALLGWGPPDGQEVRLDPLSLTDGFPTMFDIADVSSSPAFFDVKKLLFVNGEHLRALPLDTLDELSQPYLVSSSVGEAYGADPANRERFRQLLPEVQTRVETLSEVPGYVDFLFVDEPEVDQKAWDKAMVPDAAAWLDAVIAAAADWPWEAEQLHERFMALAEELDANRRKFQAPVRVALTGRSVGPPLFESMVVLGRDTTLARLRAARAGLGSEG